jgi:cytochrome c
MRSSNSAATVLLVYLLLLPLSLAPAMAMANPALARKHGCLGCHAVTSKLVGPAYQDVAATYSGQPGAREALAARIRQGGSGKWGEMVMPPQPQLSEADARRLATWILGGAK